MDLDTLLQRARSALRTPTFYWLGKGGSTENRPATGQPGEAFNLERELEIKKRDEREVYDEYIEAERKFRIDRATLPKFACDCSGFVCWALDISRNGWPEPIGWFNTDKMFDDANGARRYFEKVERAVPGVLIVYPKPPGNKGPGHVGIVTEVDADGQATRVLHCSPHNYVIEPPPGLSRNAIAETDMSAFRGKPKVLYMKWKAAA